MNGARRPHIKICGLTRLEDARLAAELGAWAVGFILSPASPRATTAEHAGQIVRALKVPALRTVGVFVNASFDEIMKSVETGGFNTVQLHGDESPDFSARIRARLAGISVIKALRPRGLEDLSQLPLYRVSCDAVLLDTYVAGRPGGTGVTGDWSLAAEGARHDQVILAGGLNPDNIHAALGTPGIFGVDASSGLEESPGIKSQTKMRKFFENAEREA